MLIFYINPQLFLLFISFLSQFAAKFNYTIILIKNPKMILLLINLLQKLKIKYITLTNLF